MRRRRIIRNEERGFHWDEILEQETREQLQEIGCDEIMIEMTLDEIRSGESVTVQGPGGTFSFNPGRR
jgi:hypothetical protein